MGDSGAGPVLAFDTRLLAYLVWGIGTVTVYAIALRQAWHRFTKRHDRRARRELWERVPLFGTAVAASVATLMVLFGESGSGARGFTVAFALGCFLAAGIIMATDRANGA